MQRKSLTILFLLLATAFNYCIAKQVDLKSAQKAGLNFYYERISQYQTISFADLKVKETFPVSFNGRIAYYVMNLTDKGFVVVSADDAVPAVIAYSFDGVYSESNQPPQFAGWMDGYAKQIDKGITMNYMPSAEVSNEWSRLLTADADDLMPLKNDRDVTPLIISTWDQGGPYNFLCPADAGGPGGHVWAGCVATAMSQVMFYYRYPLTGLGSHCYYPWGYPQQCADFGNTTYEWNEMMNVVATKDTAPAQLQWHAGIAVDMMYSPNGSGAYSGDALNALKANFKYGSQAQLLEKDNYPEAQWESIMRDNLDHKRPMYYDGYGTGGHAFNLDGYQGTSYFHFNWGWSGSFNGYFYLSNLNPGGDDFTNGQGAIVDLYPDTTLYTYPYYCQGQTILTGLYGTFEDGSGPRDYHNNGNCEWLISPVSNSDSITSITITFNKFETEAANDVVTIYQGDTPNDLIVGQFSGSEIPAAITVQGNKALITFVTNGSVSKSGWYITYRTESMDWCESMSTYTANLSNVSDGSLGFNYKNGTVCRWEIVPSENNDPVTLYFTSFNTEQGNDILQIYDYESQEMLAAYSGDYNPDNLPAPVTSPSGKMFLMFITNGSVNDKGWEGFYSNDPVGIKDKNGISGISLYPNPATDLLTIQMTNQKSWSGSLELYSVEGKMMMKRLITFNPGIEEFQVDVSSVPAGICLLKMVNDNEVITRKVMIR